MAFDSILSAILKITKTKTTAPSIQVIVSKKEAIGKFCSWNKYMYMYILSLSFWSQQSKKIKIGIAILQKAGPDL